MERMRGDTAATAAEAAGPSGGDRAASPGLIGGLHHAKLAGPCAAYWQRHPAHHQVGEGC